MSIYPHIFYFYMYIRFYIIYQMYIKFLLYIFQVDMFKRASKF